MIEWLLNIDKEVFVALHGLNHTFLDPVMVFFSAKWVWLPLYAGLLYIFFRHFKRKAFIIILALAVTIGVSDRLTSGVMKPTFARLRPCHEPALVDQVRTIDGCGGRFGFPSSHAANSFALASFFFLLFQRSRRYFVLITWACVVAYSRIYLGVHYPLDILVGGVLGFAIAWLMVKLLRQFMLKEN